MISIVLTSVAHNGTRICIWSMVNTPLYNVFSACDQGRFQLQFHHRLSGNWWCSTSSNPAKLIRAHLKSPPEVPPENVVPKSDKDLNLIGTSALIGRSDLPPVARTGILVQPELAEAADPFPQLTSLADRWAKFATCVWGSGT